MTWKLTPAEHRTEAHRLLQQAASCGDRGDAALLVSRAHVHAILGTAPTAEGGA